MEIMKKVLFDTCAYTNMFRGNPEVFQLFESSEKIFVSSFVLGELFYGFKNGKKEDWNKNLLSTFLEKGNIEVIPATEETAEFFGHIKYELRKKGFPIPTNDVWIAAHAMETGAELITFDRYFENIPGLRVKILNSSD